MRYALVALLASLLAGCSLFGIRSGTEQPPYEVIESLDEAIELRRYGPRLAAEVEVAVAAGDEDEARNAAFRILAAYIFGENRAQQEIAMTAPVEVAEEAEGREIAMTAPVEIDRVETAGEGEGRLTMRFFLPSAFSEANVPQPKDERVRILTVPGETLAVRRFTGWRGPEVVAAEEEQLRQALDGSAWRPAGAAVAYFYHPPWTLPFLRRNAVVLPVAGG